MKIEKNNVVGVSYELTVDGNLYDIATKEQPLEYIHGTHMLIPKFEEAVEGLQAGDTFAFDVEPEEGYGEYDISIVKDWVSFEELDKFFELRSQNGIHGKLEQMKGE